MLKPDGTLIALNETPLGTARYFYKVMRTGMDVAARSMKGGYQALSPSIAVSGVLYDPYLGDIIYSFKQWAAAFAQTGFSSIVIRTELSAHKRPMKRPARLVHFVLRKAHSAGRRDMHENSVLLFRKYVVPFVKGRQPRARDRPRQQSVSLPAGGVRSCDMVDGRSRFASQLAR